MAQALPGGPWQGRIPSDQLGRSARDLRRIDDSHDQQARPRPRRRILTDSRNVAGQLCRRQPFHVADRRRGDEFLRLVLRPAAGLTRGLGRADRCARVGRLVQRPLHRRDGCQPQHDPHPRHPLHLRSASRRRQAGRVQPRLQPGRQVRRLVDPVAPRPGHGVLVGREPCPAQRVLPRPQGRVLRAVLTPVHRSPVPGRDQGRSGRQVPACRPPEPLRTDRKRRVEAADVGWRGQRGTHAERQHRRPLGNREQGQVEPQVARQCARSADRT